MRALIWCVLCGAMAAQPQASRENLCAVDGKVVNEITGQPLKDATLTLRLLGAAQSIFTTVSDESGNFAFAGIEPGEYAISAERAGFIAGNFRAKRPRGPGTPLTLALAQNITGVEFKLAPQGVIAGRVLDTDGDPVQYSSVRLMRRQYVNGRQKLSVVDASEVANRSGAQQVTNDQGEYRFFGLAPGRYYVNASTGGAEIERVGQDRSTRPPREVYVETFHPSTVDARRAEPVEVLAGKVASGANVVLARVPVARIRGRVVNLAEVTAGGSPGVSIYRTDGAFVGGASLGKQGEFDINARATQGSAWLIARVQTGSSAGYFSRQSLSLGSGPTEGVEISLSPGIPFRGNVRLEDGGAVRVDLRSIRISLALPDLDIGGPMPQAAVGTDGSFTGGSVGPDRYLLTVSGMPSGIYVKSIRMGEADALEDGLDLTRGAPAPVEIVLSGKSGAVEGLVRDEKDEPASGVTVALVPQSAKRRERPDWYRTAITDQQGRFAMAGLPPGEYKLFAWEDVEDGAYMDPEFLKPLEASGSAVMVREGASESVELRVIAAP